MQNLHAGISFLRIPISEPSPTEFENCNPVWAALFEIAQLESPKCEIFASSLHKSRRQTKEPRQAFTSPALHAFSLEENSATDQQSAFNTKNKGFHMHMQWLFRRKAACISHYRIYSNRNPRVLFHFDTQTQVVLEVRVVLINEKGKF